MYAIQPKVTIQDIRETIVRTQTDIEIGMSLYACCSLRDKIETYLDARCILPWCDFSNGKCPFCSFTTVIDQSKGHNEGCGFCPLRLRSYTYMLDCEYYRPNTARVNAGVIMKLGMGDTRIDLIKWWTKTLHEFEWLYDELQKLIFDSVVGKKI